MLTLRGREVQALARGLPFDAGDLAAGRQRLLDAGLRDLVGQATRDIDAIERDVSMILACAGASPPAACQVTRRYLQQTTRTAEPPLVFAQLVYAFELARAERRVAGINIVAPEDFYVARRDYGLHMRMVGWLGEQYPEVSVALHAGG